MIRLVNKLFHVTPMKEKSKVGSGRENVKRHRRQACECLEEKHPKQKEQ